MEIEYKNAIKSEEFVTSTPLIKSCVYNVTDYIGIGSGNFSTYLYSTSSKIHNAHVGTGNNQNGQMYMPIILPNDLKTLINIKVGIMRDGAVDTATATLSKDGTNDAGITNINVLPTSDLTRVIYTLTPTGSYVAGDILLLKLDSTVDNGEYFETYELVLNYNPKTKEA